MNLNSQHIQSIEEPYFCNCRFDPLVFHQLRYHCPAPQKLNKTINEMNTE